MLLRAVLPTLGYLTNIKSTQRNQHFRIVLDVSFGKSVTLQFSLRLIITMELLREKFGEMVAYWLSQIPLPPIAQQSERNLMKILMPWNFEGASCWGIDTDFFFPENHGITEENRVAKKICNSCRWKQECLTYALHYRVLGIWGGTSESERKRMRRKLNIIPKPITNERNVA